MGDKNLERLISNRKLHEFRSGSNPRFKDATSFSSSSGITDVLSISQPNLPERLLDQIRMHTEVPSSDCRKWGKVCLIVLCRSKDLSGDSSEDALSDEDDSSDGLCDDTCIYTVDLDKDYSDEWSCRVPTIRCSLLRMDIGCLCVLGTTLYMFEGHWSEGGTRVYTYEMPTSDTTNLKLDRTDLVETTSMNYPKYGAQATPTPNGKIIVLSTMVHFDHVNRHKCPFELYNPCDRVWQQLPPLPRGYKTDPCMIHGLTFLRNEPVLLIHSDMGMFTLDLGSPDKDFLWKKYNPFSIFPGRYPPRPNSSFVIIGENLCLTGWGTYELENSYSFRYPRPKVDLHAKHHVTLLEMIEQRECYFCGVLNWVDKETMTPHLIINVYHLDYVKYNEVDKDKAIMDKVVLPGATVLKSFKFHSIPLVNDEFNIFYFSSMSTSI